MTARCTYAVYGIIGITSLSGCQATTASKVADTATAPATITQVVAATSTECPDGGLVVESFLDTNGNGKLDASESIVSQQAVCNGATGAQGEQGQGAGLLVVAAGQGACPAGGSSITAFIDTNNNGNLDPGETITAKMTVCNGMAGATGAAGQNASLTTSAATPTQCANGGVVYTSSSPGSTPISTPVCIGATGATGASGTNAVFETGPVGDPVPGKTYSACHHDYLYIPDSSDDARGWLIFRHQENGAADQGIGSTGFQVWDVDISDFELVSEVGNVTYCSLHWDPTAKRLDYSVVDDSDGLAGRTGAIQM